MSDDKELKPCPFCGGEDLDIVSLAVVMDRDWWTVDCNDCAISGPMGLGEEKAIKSWNTRAK
jgi:Lar family restriction alleviation protein